MNKTVWAVRFVMLAMLPMGLLAFPSTGLANDKGFYIGAGITGLQTTLDYGATETYSTTHGRVTVGYQFLKFLSVEGRFMSSSKDTDVDDFGFLFELDTGNIVGLYLRPHSNFKNVNVYGIVGLTSMNTKYRFALGGPVDSDNVVALTYGVGASFTLVKGLMLEVEAMAFAGSADYNTYFFDTVDVYGAGLGATLRYRF